MPAIDGTMRLDGRRGAFPLAARRAGRRHRHGAPGAPASCPTSRSPRTSFSARSRQPARHRRLAAHGARGARACSPASASTSTRDARIGRAADRPAAADRARPRAVLGRAHHHPRRADLGAVAARGRAPVRGAAPAARRAAAASSSSRISSTTSCAISDTVTIFRNGRKSRPTTAAGDRQGLGHRAHDRRGPRGARGELYRRDQARQPPERAGRAGGRGSRAGRAFATSRSTCGPARCWASTASWAAASSSWRARCSASSARQRRTARSAARPARSRSTAAGAAGRHRLRAGEPARDAVPPRAGLQEHVDQRSWSRIARPAAQARRASARSRERHVEALPDPARRGRDACSAACRAATSRRWRWPMADPAAAGAGAERADARHGCRRQGGRGATSCAACATRGIAIVVLSTEPETVLSLADRILVMKQGRDRPRIRRRDDQQGPAARGGMRRSTVNVTADTAAIASAAQWALAARPAAQYRAVPDPDLPGRLLQPSPARPSPRSTMSATS